MRDSPGLELCWCLSSRHLWSFRRGDGSHHGPMQSGPRVCVFPGCRGKVLNLLNQKGHCLHMLEGRFSWESVWLSLLVLSDVILRCWCFGYGSISFFVQCFQKAPSCEVNKNNFSWAFFTQWRRRSQWGCEWGHPHHKMGPDWVAWRQSWHSVNSQKEINW